jgi:type VI secretion system secreted protein Hcp
MPIYMKYGAIAGDVTESGHTGWIELNSFQWGVGRGVSSPTGSSEDRESSAPSVSEVTVTKEFDKASIKLLTEAYQGTGGGDAATVQLDFTRTTQGKLQIYATFILSNVIISGYSLSSGGDRPSESLSLNFVKIESQFIPMKPDGTADNPIKITYDLGKATSS